MTFLTPFNLDFTCNTVEKLTLLPVIAKTNGNYSILIFSDLSAAFDAVGHPLLLIKLH